MATLSPLLGPAVPFGLDTGLYDLDQDPSSLRLSEYDLDEMTADPSFDERVLSEYYFVDSSPTDPILTPASTLDEHGDSSLPSAANSRPASDTFSPSPSYHRISPSATVDDFRCMDQFDMSHHNHHQYHPQVTGPAHSPSSTRPSTDPSVAGSVSSRSHVPSFSSTHAADNWISQAHITQADDHFELPTDYSFAGSVATTESLNSELFPSYDSHSVGNFNAHQLPFRALEDGSDLLPTDHQHLPVTTFGTHGQLPAQALPSQIYAHHAPTMDLSQSLQMRLQYASPPPHNSFEAHANSHPFPNQQHHPPPSPPQLGANTHNVGKAESVNAIALESLARQARPRQRLAPRNNATSSNAVTKRDRNSVLAARNSSSEGSTLSARNIQPANLIAKAVPSRGYTSRSSVGRKKGGREKDSHLDEDARKKSHGMRKTGACWRCVLQRDPCPDTNLPCTRCLKSKGHTFFFPCNRDKLPQFLHDFLPPTMTMMHQKQILEDCVNNQIWDWDQGNCIDIYLTSGYGPPLKWRVYEFIPKTADLLGQYQFLQSTTRPGTMIPMHKYSPPWGVLKLETSDVSKFEVYLDQLMDPQYLEKNFGWTCFEEETGIDDFQARLLDHMCTLYIYTTDEELRGHLQNIIRMILVTYIMGHTLTIDEATLPSVLTSLRHSAPPANAVQQHTSPRLANRQLKFFFSTLRNALYESLLNWHQQTLHSSGKKDHTWLPAFTVMLAFAMVLEEVQRTLQIQAHTKAQVGEMAPEAAWIEAEAACERIDERFALLVGLFQCKYRDRRWSDNGCFGPGTPDLPKDGDEASQAFLTDVWILLLEKRAHLETRENVRFGQDSQCLYTSRLVGRFLLPFTRLSPASR